MTKRNFTNLILPILFLFSVIIPWAGEAASPETFWRGSASAQKEPFIKVVETKEEWSALWMRALEKPAPEIDFNRYAVACVFLGHKADWLYAISISEPVLERNTWVVPYGLAEIVLELSGPFKARGQYAMKVVERKKDAPMVMQEISAYGGRR